MNDALPLAALRELQARTAPDPRLPADLERNVALWLAVRSGASPAWSSLRCRFEPAQVDVARITEAPYLGALGFLVDANGIAIARESSLHHALNRIVTRAAHTLERTGYADHPLVLAGLVLLARRIAGEPHLATLCSAVEATARRGPAETLVLGAATGVALAPVAPDTGRALDLACLALGRRLLGDRLASFFAWDRSIDPDAQLKSLVTVQAANLDGLDALLAIAAIEAAVGPATALESGDELSRRALRPCALVITAIPVEFAAVRALLGEVHEETDPQGTVYEVGAAGAWAVYLAEFGPGNVSAAARTERAMQFLSGRLRVAIFVGVAGGVKDVEIGDVVVATKVHAYESGKDTTSGFRIRPDSDRSSYAVVERARAEARKPDWARDLGSDGRRPAVLLGPIAAGEKVVASKRSATAQFLRKHYGDVLAVEMEGAGFLRAADARPDVEALVVRGISDLLSGKASSDRAGSQARAARNAAAFAVQVLRALPLPSPR